MPVEPDVQQVRPVPTWLHRIGILVFVVFCFEVGVFLLVFPWMHAWDANGIADQSYWLHDLWDSAYFRGALSGLGVVNIYISLVELLRLRRPSSS
jgi:hypothetical protein